MATPPTRPPQDATPGKSGSLCQLGGADMMALLGFIHPAPHLTDGFAQERYLALNALHATSHCSPLTIMRQLKTPGQVAAYIAECSSETRAALDRIDDAVLKKDRAMLVSAMHGLKNSLLSLGLNNLADTSQELEVRLRASEPDDWSDILTALRYLNEQIGSAIEQISAEA